MSKSHINSRTRGFYDLMAKLYKMGYVHSPDANEVRELDLNWHGDTDSHLDHNIWSVWWSVITDPHHKGNFSTVCWKSTAWAQSDSSGSTDIAWVVIWNYTEHGNSYLSRHRILVLEKGKWPMPPFLSLDQRIEEIGFPIELRASEGDEYQARKEKVAEPLQVVGNVSKLLRGNRKGDLARLASMLVDCYPSQSTYVGRKSEGQKLVPPVMLLPELLRDAEGHFIIHGDVLLARRPEEHQEKNLQPLIYT